MSSVLKLVCTHARLVGVHLPVHINHALFMELGRRHRLQKPWVQVKAAIQVQVQVQAQAQAQAQAVLLDHHPQPFLRPLDLPSNVRLCLLLSNFLFSFFPGAC